MSRQLLQCLGTLLLAPLVYGLIEKLDIVDDDRRVFHITSFGYEPGGHFEMEWNLQMVTPQFKNKYKVAFILEQSDTEGGTRVQERSTSTCFHDDLKREEVDATEIPHDWTKPNQLQKFSASIEFPGYYHLYFSNCEDASTLTSFQLKLTQFNVAEDGTPIYLSAGKAILPTLYAILCGMFLVALVIWMHLLYSNWSRSKPLHLLMSFTLVFKILSLMFDAFSFHALKSQGIHTGWTAAFYVISSLKGMMLFSVIVLVGTGWSYLKPFLTDRDKRLLIAVLVVQGMVNISRIVFEETAPGAAGWLTWRDTLHLLDMICWCVILLPIVWSIRHLREASDVDGKAARNVHRLKRFRTFYLLVVGYIYFTRIIVFLLEATLPFEYTWVGTVFHEFASLAFYLTTGNLFRPQAVNPYLPVDQDVGDLNFDFEMDEAPSERSLNI